MWKILTCIFIAASAQKINYGRFDLDDFGNHVFKSEHHSQEKDQIFEDQAELELDFEPFSEKLTVHIVMHTHDDVGWLKTKDHYYSGENPENRSNAKVKQILDSVISELLKKESRKFSYVEMSYFSIWWNE